MMLEIQQLRDDQQRLAGERAKVRLIEESLDVQMTHLKQMEVAQFTNEEEIDKYKAQADRLRAEKAELAERQKKLEEARQASVAREEELSVQITHLKEVNVKPVREVVTEVVHVVSEERQAEIDNQNYNLKIAEALRKVEEEKRLRLREEAAERRKQLELEMLVEKNRGKNKGDVKGKYLY